MISFRFLPRGSLRGEFTDMVKQECLIQMAYINDDNCLRLGVSKDLNGAKGAQMHLTQGMVQDLIPILKEFAETGTMERFVD